jgi:hypothetical protein
VPAQLPERARLLEAVGPVGRLAYGDRGRRAHPERRDDPEIEDAGARAAQRPVQVGCEEAGASRGRNPLTRDEAPHADSGSFSTSPASATRKIRKGRRRAGRSR